jgi:hypothetical protein
VSPQTVVVKNYWALGDTVVLTAALRDLAKAHPGKFRVAAVGSYTSVYAHNPHVTAGGTEVAGKPLVVDYEPGIGQSRAGAGLHFTTFFHQDFGRRLGVPIPVTAPHADLHFSPAEAPRVATGRFWVVVAGGKEDITCKWWPQTRYQAVVDRLRADGIWCVQSGGHFHGNHHPPLSHCVSAVGHTDDVRQMFRLIRDAEGVICGVTGAMHVAAALGKPCVVIAGGREERKWEAYTNEGQFGPTCPPVKVPHRFLDTIGKLDCCKTIGCWRSHAAPHRPDQFNDPSKVCLKTVVEDRRPVPACLDLVTVDQVVDAVHSYYADGTLPPPDRGGAAPRILLPASNRQPQPPLVFLAAPPPASAAPPAPPPPAAPKPSAAAAGDPLAALDHPVLGGKLTVFVLCHGEHPELARRCIGSILSTLPTHRLDLRVGLNQVGPATADFVRRLPPGVLTASYPDAGARRKYPCMRQMFRDPAHPVRTPYLVWFDDDTQAIDPLWPAKLAEAVVRNHPTGGRLYGTPYVHDFGAYRRPGHDPLDWARTGTWWKGKDLAFKDGTTFGPGGTCARFAAGYFWAMATELIQAADVPDPRLNHNGGDITIGAQVQQAGFKLVPLNPGKSLVWCPAREAGGRRGFSEQFPWVGR